MRRWTDSLALSVAALLVVGGLGGCDVPGSGPPAGKAGLESGAPPPPPLAKAPAGAPSAAGAEQEPPVAPPAEQPTVTQPPPAAPPTAPPVTSPPAVQPRPPIAPTPSTAKVLPIRLSAGVALPQTGPTGILMSFSVDYRFTAGGPNPTSPYVWVIERSKGEPKRVPERLRSKGTLAVLILGWRPEQGPFRSHVEDAHGNRLSRSISLR